MTFYNKKLNKIIKLMIHLNKNFINNKMNKLKMVKKKL